jgi:hypothetical protein
MVGWMARGRDGGEGSSLPTMGSPGPHRVYCAKDRLSRATRLGPEAWDPWQVSLDREGQGQNGAGDAFPTPTPVV